MRQNQKGFSAVGILLVLVALGLVGFTGFYVSQSYKSTSGPQDETQSSGTSGEVSFSSTTKNATIDSILQGVDYELIDAIPGSVCSDDRGVCYTGETLFLKMSYPVPDTIRKVAANLNREQWLLNDGGPANSFLESDTIATLNDVPDRGLILKEPGADKNYGNWSYFNPSFFGNRETMHRNGEGLYFFAFSNAEVQTNEQPYYIILSELSVDNLYDFDKLLSILDDDSYILSITIGEK